ncbi:MAG TPA: ThiF family adenylyltransferase [Ktedonobacteraceae bacterium]|nr:ThiF family adenylyltransferase [Ktedonobacteraceae bacterium]
MNTHVRNYIKFKQEDLAYLRNMLLEDLSREHFGILLGKTQQVEGHTIINVIDMFFPERTDYYQQNVAFLRIKKEFIHKMLVELNNRYDVDTIIDVHTHPFSPSHVAFSATDDSDERTFFHFLNDTFDNIHYASIVFSQTQYSARVWTFNHNHSIVARRALLKTQTSRENIASADFREETDTTYEKTALAQVEGFFHRSALALGLDVMRTIMHDQTISIVGVGGLGSVVAEHLIHMGFHDIHLIDPDVLEMSNLNRVVGAYYEDAEQKRYKVDVVKRHLTGINPKATVRACRKDIHDPEVEQALALSDWIIVATDNHSSRLKAQQLSIKYFVPLLSLGVNITVNNHKIEDMSGEVITARVGDYLCLSCLNRINPIKVASERHPDQGIREALVKRGYVTGQDIKEPAVKTLNTFLATMAVEVLINQYTGARKHVPVLVFENNEYMSVYEDKESVQYRNKQCFLCNV